jgi:hypothetical protein
MEGESMEFRYMPPFKKSAGKTENFYPVSFTYKNKIIDDSATRSEHFVIRD